MSFRFGRRGHKNVQRLYPTFEGRNLWFGFAPVIVRDGGINDMKKFFKVVVINFIPIVSIRLGNGNKR